MLLDQGSAIAMENNNNPAYIEQALEAIKIMETRGQKQPYQTLHSPVELYISGTKQEIAKKAAQFKKDGFVVKETNNGPVVVAQALGAYGILDIDFNRFAKDAGLPGFDFRAENNKAWHDAAVQDKIAKNLAEKYFNRFGSWDLVRVAWYGGPGRAQKLKNDGNYQLKANVKEDLEKFKLEFSNLSKKEVPTNNIGEDVVINDPNNLGLGQPPGPNMVRGFDPRSVPPSSFETSDVMIPSQGPYGKAESTVASLFASLLPESSRGSVTKTPGSAREIR